MFISIPLFIIIAALLALGFMVWRKWPFLKKLEPDAHQVGESFVHDLAPEAVSRARAVHWRALWRQALQAAEEVLNGIRAIFHSIGQAFDRLRASVQSAKRSMPEPQPVGQQPPAPQEPKIAGPPRDDEAEQKRLLKEEEQRLILDIAQDPKNVNLYVALGKVYTKLENSADAVESFKTASKLDPDDDAIKERLTRAGERLEKEKEKKEREKMKEKEQEAERAAKEQSSPEQAESPEN